MTKLGEMTVPNKYGSATLNCEPRKVSLPAKNRGESESATKEDVRKVWGERNQFPRNLWPGVYSKASGEIRTERLERGGPC